MSLAAPAEPSSKKQLMLNTGDKAKILHGNAEALLKM